MTGGRPMLPGPATTDVVGRLSALSPGDRVTSSLPCRRWVGSGQPGPTLALTSVLAKRWYEPYIPPRRQASLLRPPGFPASQRSRHTAPAVPTPRQSNSPRTSPTRPGPVQLAPDQSNSPRTSPAWRRHGHHRRTGARRIPLARGQHATDDGAVRRGQDLSRLAALSRRSRNAALALRPTSPCRRSRTAASALRPVSLSRKSCRAALALRPPSAGCPPCSQAVSLAHHVRSCCSKSVIADAPSPRALPRSRGYAAQQAFVFKI